MVERNFSYLYEFQYENIEKLEQEKLDYQLKGYQTAVFLGGTRDSQKHIQSFLQNKINEKARKGGV